MSITRILAVLSKKATATGLAVVLAASTFAAGDVLAQATGSRVGGSSAPMNSVQVADHDEISRIQVLLSNGHANEAVDLARDYIFGLEAAQFAEVNVHYNAINAYCAALSATGAYEDALGACDTAIGLLPGRWEAINTRGSAHYSAGQFGKAATDYRAALSVAPGGNVSQLLLNNIRIAESRATS